jgi:hypothetical protein
VELIEFLAWACAVGGVLSGLVLPPAIAQWSVYAGSAMFAGALAFSGKVRGRPFLSERFWGVLTVAWAVVAIAYQFSGVGFLAVLALVNFLGVGITVHPFCYVFGFKDEDRLAQATAGGCIVTSAYAMAAAAGANLGVFEVFRSGALSLGSFTWFLGLLIITSKWYRKANAGYAWRQAIAVVSFSLAISIGLIFGLRELAAIATAFLLFYLAAKLIEIPTQNYIAFGLKLMAGGGVLFGAWTWLQNHQELALKYFAG